MSRAREVLEATIRVGEMHLAASSYNVKHKRAMVALGEELIRAAPTMQGTQFPISRLITIVQGVPKMREELAAALVQLATSQGYLAELHKISADLREE